MDLVKKKSRKLKRKIFGGLVFLMIFIGLMFFLFSGDNFNVIKEIFREGVTKEEARESLASLGWKGYFTVGILSMFQVVLTFLPAEPVQVMAGISFGIFNGALICLAGVFVGNTIIYIAYKIYGQRLTEYFEYNTEFDFEYARRSKKIALIILILYFLPAIPYGLICFFAASLNLKYPKYILLTTLGAIPSIFIGVGLGHMAMTSSWITSLIVFAILIVLIVILIKNKSKVFKAVNNFLKKREMNRPKKPNRFIYNTLLFGTSCVFKSKIKIRLKNDVGRLERPALVLCNHGSFIDFFYAEKLLKKEHPFFVSARLYFYHKRLGKFLLSMGAIPKSMFTTDVENVKNCMRVLSDGDVLVMMPEARLSTVGKFEGIQESTLKFIKHIDAPVYCIRFDGDYFAYPKWGKGVRKGSLVEGEIKKLFSAGEAKDLPIEELKSRITSALDYDEFSWLEKHPEITYKNKNIAEGLENILCICPKCHAVSSFTSDKNTITCEHCGMQTSIDNRYSFVGNEYFKNFADWYDWQTQEIKKEIENTPDYKLESKVELRHGSIDGKSLTRHAGEGVCTLDKTGLTYRGTRDGEEVEKFFPMSQIYRLLFGAGIDFEIYENKEIWFFVPENKRTCVIWYIVSGLLKG